MNASTRVALLERERRWRAPVATACFAAVALMIAAAVVAASVGGGGEADILREIEAHSSEVTIANALRAAGLILLLLPFVYLFRAAQGRSDRMRGQLIGLAVAAPVFLAAATVFTGIATKEAASDFVEGSARADLSAESATRECRSERNEDRTGFQEEFGNEETAISDCADEKVANNAAENARSEASVGPAAIILELGGRLSVAIVLAYSCLWAMRTGLLTRFSGALGIALAVSQFLIPVFLLVIFLWFAYFGLLVAGWVPGGRPPAWAAGEAVPWPSPGERMAGVESADDEDVPKGGAKGDEPEA